MNLNLNYNLFLEIKHLRNKNIFRYHVEFYSFKFIDCTFKVASCEAAVVNA